jgi:hypothetical protein
VTTGEFLVLYAFIALFFSHTAVYAVEFSTLHVYIFCEKRYIISRRN